MYQINKDVEQLLEAHGIKIKSQIDMLTFKTVAIDCPKCNAKIRIAFDPEEVASHIPGTGIANIVLDLPARICRINRPETENPRVHGNRARNTRHFRTARHPLLAKPRTRVG
jgi:hypothetical protein